MVDIFHLRPVSWPKPRLVIWECGPANPEASRGQARDLSAAAEAFKLLSAEVVAEASLVAMLSDPEIKGLHEDRLAEAITLARAQLDVIERLSEHPTSPEAA